MSATLTRFMTADQFRKATIAQADDDDWQESGYVCILLDGTAYVARYSHCSCYGTFTSLAGGGISDYVAEGDASFDWCGDVFELVRMATEKLDPAMPTRPVNEKDYDYDHLTAMYDQVVKWWSQIQALYHYTFGGDPTTVFDLGVLGDYLEGMGDSRCEMVRQCVRI